MGAWQSLGPTGLKRRRDVPSHQEEAGSGPYKEREALTRFSSAIPFQVTGEQSQPSQRSKDPRDEVWLFRQEILSSQS